MTVGLGWRGCWRIARRDLHPGFRGLRLLFVCLFLGVATLATIGNLTAAITGEIASKGRLLLGGDVEVALSQREASGEEKAAFRRFGQLSETIRLRAMAQRPGSGDGPSAVLTELKGVDAAYPLYGTLMLKSGPAGTLPAGGGGGGSVPVVGGSGRGRKCCLSPVRAAQRNHAVAGHGAAAGKRRRAFRRADRTKGRGCRLSPVWHADAEKRTGRNPRSG